jgi:hypothetical protein
MPKKKGTPGGRLPVIKSLDEYDMILNFLLKKWTIPVEWTSSKKQGFLERMKQYVVLDNGKSGDYPNGPQIYVRSKTSSDIIGTAKLYVPEWHKEQIMKKFHGAGTPGVHFGRTRIHELVNQEKSFFLTSFQIGNAHVGVTEKDVTAHLKDCPNCKVSSVMSLNSI